MMDRLDEELAEADIVHRDPDAVQFLIENYGKGFSKYLTEIIKFHERENAQESESTKSLSRIYGTLRFGLNHNRMPLRPFYDSVGTELSQWINSLDERRSVAACAALEDLKRHRNQYSTKCKSLKEQWKATKARYMEAREAHKAAKANYYRLGREKEKMIPALGEDSNSLGSSDVLDHISSGGDGLDGVRTGSTPVVTPISKRERQRIQLEAKFIDAENEYREAVCLFRSRITERTQCHVEQLASLKQAAMEVDGALLRTEEKLLRLARDQASSTIAKIDQRMTVIKEYKAGSCYVDWTAERMNAPAAAVEDESNVTFVPFVTAFRDSSSNLPTSPPVVARFHPRSGSPATFDRRSADLLLETKRDSVDGSSEGSTPGSSRKSHFRSSEEIAQKTPELTPTEEEVRATSVTPAQASRTSWFHKTIKRWANTGAGRTSSLGGGSGSSPPPCAGPSLDEEMRAIRQIVHKCVQALDKTGLTTEGLYRRGGSEARTRDIINDMFENPDKVALDEFSPLVLCAVIKKCFIKMRDPLFTETLHSDFVRVGLNPDANDAVEDLKKIIQSLPPLNMEIASIFIHHLHRVANVEENQMSYESLGICLAPTLLHQKHLTNMHFQCSSLHKKPQSVKHSKEIMANLEVKECSRVLTLIIENVDYLFGSEVVSEEPSGAEWTAATLPSSSCQLDLGSSKVCEYSVPQAPESAPSDQAAAAVKPSAKIAAPKSPLPQHQQPCIPSSASSAGVSKGSVTDSVWSSGSSSGLGHASWASGSQTGRSEGSPPPVPPALGRRKHSTEKAPGKKAHGSSILSIFRRLRSLDDGVDMDKSFSHGYNPLPNGLRTPPPPPSATASVSVTNDNDTNNCHEDTATSEVPAAAGKQSVRQSKAAGRVFIENGGGSRRRGSLGDVTQCGLYRGLGPPPTPPPKPAHLSIGGLSADSDSSSASNSRKSSCAACENGSAASHAPLIRLRSDDRPRTRYIFLRRQSDPNGLSLLGGRSSLSGSVSDIFSNDEIDARRERRASTVSGAPFEPLPSSRVFVPRRSQPEFV